MTELFFKLCGRHFAFLIEEFGCRVGGKKSDAFEDELIYRNATTAVKIRYEPREKYVFVLLCRLVNGKIPPYPIFVRHEKELTQFYLDDLLTLRSPATIIRKKYHRERFADKEDLHQAIKASLEEPFTEQNLEHMIKTYAAALREHGSDILKGNFTVFAELEKIVRKRTAEFR